jgi:hypothetical protein
MLFPNSNDFFHCPDLTFKLNMPSYLHIALAQQQSWEVAMNQVIFAPFQNPRRAIGTQNLNGCTAVAVISQYGAILAHIPPAPYPTHDPHLGIQNLERLMNQLVSLYHTHAYAFPAGGTSLVVGAFYGGSPALPHHLERIRSILLAQGLTPLLRMYNVTLGGHPGPAQGTVFIDARSGRVTVYVEDQPLGI